MEKKLTQEFEMARRRIARSRGPQFFFVHEEDQKTDEILTWLRTELAGKNREAEFKDMESFVSDIARNDEGSPKHVIVDFRKVKDDEDFRQTWMYLNQLRTRLEGTEKIYIFLLPPTKDARYRTLHRSAPDLCHVRMPLFGV